MVSKRRQNRRERRIICSQDCLVLNNLFSFLPFSVSVSRNFLLGNPIPGVAIFASFILSTSPPASLAAGDEIWTNPCLCNGFFIMFLKALETTHMRPPGTGYDIRYVGAFAMSHENPSGVLTRGRMNLDWI